MAKENIERDGRVSLRSRCPFLVFLLYLLIKIHLPLEGYTILNYYTSILRGATLGRQQDDVSLIPIRGDATAALCEALKTQLLTD